MTDREIVDASAAAFGSPLWAVLACGHDQESQRVVAVMRTRASANSLMRRLILSRRFSGVWVEMVPPIAHVLRGEVRL